MNGNSWRAARWIRWRFLWIIFWVYSYPSCALCESAQGVPVLVLDARLDPVMPTKGIVIVKARSQINVAETSRRIVSIHSHIGDLLRFQGLRYRPAYCLREKDSAFFSRYSFPVGARGLTIRVAFKKTDVDTFSQFHVQGRSFSAVERNISNRQILIRYGFSGQFLSDNRYPCPLIFSSYVLHLIQLSHNDAPLQESHDYQSASQESNIQGESRNWFSLLKPPPRLWQKLLSFAFVLGSLGLILFIFGLFHESILLQNIGFSCCFGAVLFAFGIAFGTEFIEIL